MLKGIKALVFQPDDAEDAIRAWLFTAKDQATASAAATRAIDGFRDRCSYNIVEDVDDLKSAVPRLSSNMIVNAGDTFGFCGWDGDRKELGWIKLSRVYSCKNEILSIDYQDREIGYTKIDPGENSTFTSSGVSGDKVFWVTTTMNPAEGLNRTTFDATLHTSNSTLQPDVKTTMYSKFAAKEDPSPMVRFTQQGFAYFEASSTAFNGKRDMSLWEVSGTIPSEIPSSALPEYGQYLTFPNVEGVALKGLMPLYQGSYQKSDTKVYGVYFDTECRTVLKGLVISESDGGFGTFGVGVVQAPAAYEDGRDYIDSHPAFFSTVAPG